MSFQLKIFMFVKWIFSVWFMYVGCFKDSSDRVLESDKLSPSLLVLMADFNAGKSALHSAI